MVKKLHKFLSFLLALVLVVTTFGSDFANAKVFAVDNEVVELASPTEEIFEAIPEGESAAEVAASTESSESTEETVEVTSETKESEEISDASAEGTGSQTDEVTEEEKSKEDETQVEDEEKKEEEAAEDEIAADASTEATSEAATEATTEDETEKKDEEKKAAEKEEVVEKEFNQSTTIDDIRISLYAEPGVLPADAVLNVEKVADSKDSEIKELIDEELGEEKEVQVTYSYDINIYSESEGKFVQPEDGTVEVRFEEIEAAESEETALAVFHVEDDLSNAEQVASAGTEATEISFDAEHFSIYVVTLFNVRYPSYKTSVKIGVVDALYDAVDYNVEKFDLQFTSYDDVKTSEDLLSNISIPEGYEFISFSANRHNFYDNHFLIQAIKLKDNGILFSDSVQYQDIDGNWRNLSDGTIFAVCRQKNQKTTANHLDLGFEIESFSEYINNGAKVYAVVDGVQHRMFVNREVFRDSFDGKDYYEFRYDSDSPISAESEISFIVEAGGKTYHMNCTTEMNLEAFSRCFRAHSSTQNTFGFDYICNFDEDFHLSSAVVYYKNDGSGATYKDDLNWDSSDASATMTYNVKSLEDVFGENEDDTMTFLGWSETADGDVKYAKDAVDPSFTASNNNAYTLYAKWESNLTGKVKVAVFATDGTNSRDAEGNVVVNSALSGPLGLDYVQPNGYYPIGVVELPASLFDELGYDDNFIRSAEDWDKVCNAMTNFDESEAVLHNGNVGNKVYDAIKSGAVQVDTNDGDGYGGSQYKTALFKWNYEESTPGSVVNPDGGNFAYHLDLRFATNIVSYQAYYYIGETVDYHEDLEGKKAYLSGSAVPVEDSQEYVPSEKDDYELEGLYEDADCTVEYKGFSNLTEDKIVYAKYTKKENTDVYFFLLAKNQQKQLKNPIPGHQPDADYYPEFNGSGTWSGTATNIDLLKDEWNFSMKPEDNDGLPYYAIYYWDGVENHVEEFEYSYDSGVKSAIQKCIDDNFNKDITDEFVPFTVDNDVVWYVYKKEVNGTVVNHIDGYVSANIVYDANIDSSLVSGDAATKPEVVVVGDEVTIRDNMFTLKDQNYVFVGWSTKPDGSTGVTTYKAGDVKSLNYNTVLYAQWVKIPVKRKIKITVQADAVGDQLDVSTMYDGYVHTNDLDVTVDAEATSETVTEKVAKFFKDLFGRIAGLGVLTVYAAEKDIDFTNRRDVAPKTIDIGGITVDVEGLYTTGGRGLDTGNYPVMLHYDEMEINTKIGEDTVDIKDIFEVEIEYINGKETSREVVSTEVKDKVPTKIANLEITKRRVTLTSASDSKEYDGTALTNSKVTVSGDGFANGDKELRGKEGVKNNVTGSQTEIGSSTNYFTYTALSNTNLAKNYIVSKVEGTLTVYGAGDNPPPTDTPPTEDAPPVGTVLGATRGEVLGATREPAVLGARRGRTEDNTNTLAHVLTILVAAGVAFAMIALRKKNEDEK